MVKEKQISLGNARLLLASNRRARAGLGNDHDLVGPPERFEARGDVLSLVESDDDRGDPAARRGGIRRRAALLRQQPIGQFEADR